MRKWRDWTLPLRQLGSESVAALQAVQQALGTENSECAAQLVHSFSNLLLMCVCNLGVQVHGATLCTKARGQRCACSWLSRLPF